MKSIRGRGKHSLTTLWLAGPASMSFVTDMSVGMHTVNVTSISVGMHTVNVTEPASTLSSSCTNTGFVCAQN